MDFQNKTIGEIVAKDYRTARVFKSYGLDFCCGGKRNLLVACTEKGIDFKALEQELSVLQAIPSTLQNNYRDWSTDFLLDYITNKHHAYVRKHIPPITAFSEKVARVHGQLHPETIAIFHSWTELSEELISHLLKEEKIVFPAIKNLTARSEKSLSLTTLEKIGAPLQMMETEHERAGDLMRHIRQLSNNYTPPEGACTTYRILFQMLEEFEADLHEHVHLENNVLFPRIEELRKNIPLI